MYTATNNSNFTFDMKINDEVHHLTSNNFNLDNDALINGKPLKSINQFYNKSKANIQSLLEINHKVKSSNRLSRLHFKSK